MSRRYIIREIATEDITKISELYNSNNTVSTCWGYANNQDYCDIAYTSTDTVLVVYVSLTVVYKIEGFNY